MPSKQYKKYVSPKVKSKESILNAAFRSVGCLVEWFKKKFAGSQIPQKINDKDFYGKLMYDRLQLLFINLERLMKSWKTKDHTEAFVNSTWLDFTGSKPAGIKFDFFTLISMINSTQTLIKEICENLDELEKSQDESKQKLIKDGNAKSTLWKGMKPTSRTKYLELLNESSKKDREKLLKEADEFNRDIGDNVLPKLGIGPSSGEFMKDIDFRGSRVLSLGSKISNKLKVSEENKVMGKIRSKSQRLSKQISEKFNLQKSDARKVRDQERLLKLEERRKIDADRKAQREKAREEQRLKAEQKNKKYKKNRLSNKISNLYQKISSTQEARKKRDAERKAAREKIMADRKSQIEQNKKERQKTRQRRRLSRELQSAIKNLKK